METYEIKPKVIKKTAPGKYFFDFAETLKFCPGMLAVAPGSIMQEIADFSLHYPLQVLNYYKYTSDKDTVSELYGAVKNVVRLIMKKGLCCGVFFSFFVLKALAKAGALKEKAALLLNESEHSWINMLREGATTLFEAWGKKEVEYKSLPSVGSGSCNCFGRGFEDF